MKLSELIEMFPTDHKIRITEITDEMEENEEGCFPKQVTIFEGQAYDFIEENPERVKDWDLGFKIISIVSNIAKDFKTMTEYIESTIFVQEWDNYKDDWKLAMEYEDDPYEN